MDARMHYCYQQELEYRVQRVKNGRSLLDQPPLIDNRSRYPTVEPVLRYRPSGPEKRSLKTRVLS